MHLNVGDISWNVPGPDSMARGPCCRQTSISSVPRSVEKNQTFIYFITLFFTHSYVCKWMPNGRGFTYQNAIHLTRSCEQASKPTCLLHTFLLSFTYYYYYYYHYHHHHHHHFSMNSWLFNPLSAELYPICHLVALLGAHHILHVSRIRVI